MSGIIKNFHNKWYNKVFVFFTIVTLFMVNIWYYNRSRIIESDIMYNDIKLYQEIIKSGLVNNLQKILSGYPINNFDNNLIFNVTTLNSQQPYQDGVKISPYSIEITGSKYLITIDKVSVKEYFDNLLPTHIASTISLENIQLIKSNLVDDSYTNQTKYKLGNGLELSVILGIDKESIFYLQRLEKTKQEIQRHIIISIIIWILVVLAYYISYLMLLNKINYLKKSLHQAKAKIVNYTQKLEITSNLNVSFIRKATDIYQKEKGEERYNQLFPLLLVDSSRSKINLKDFKRELNQYFSVYSDEVLLNINLAESTGDYPLGKEVIYQIVFSIIKDLVLITKEQSEKQREIRVSFNNMGIDFEFIAFPLSITKIGKLSKILNINQPDTFLLDFDRVLLSLKEHNIEYSLSNSGNRNFFKIIFIQKELQQNVVKFNKRVK